MTSRPLPEWLTHATTARQSSGPDDCPSAPPVPSEPAGPLTGQIRRLDPMDPGAGSLLVLIVNTDPAYAAAQVLALSNEVEMASDTDTLLTGDVTGLPFDVLALTDVTGPAWYVQLGPTLATVDITVLDNSPAGTPVEGPSDPRWEWKQEQHEALMRLLGECARQVIDESPNSVVDPAALDLSVITEDELARIVQVTAPLLARHRVCMPLSALRNLNNTRVTPRSRYWDAVRCLVELIPRRPDLVVRDQPATGLPQSLRASVKHDALAGALSAAFQQLPEAHRSLRLLTLTSLWPDMLSSGATDVRQPPAQVRVAAPRVWELYLNGRRHQLLIQPVDDQVDWSADGRNTPPGRRNQTFKDAFVDNLQGALHVG